MNGFNQLKKIIAVFLFFSAIVTTTAQKQNNIVLDKIIARVDDKIVLQSELEFRFLQEKSRQKSAVDESALRCEVLRQLIIEKMLIVKAETDSVTVDDDAVENQVDNRLRVMISQFGSEEKLVEAYGKTIDEWKNTFREPVRQQLMVERMQDEIKRSVKVTPEEVKKFFKRIPQDSLPFFSKEVQIGQIVRMPKANEKQKLYYKTKLQELKDRIGNGEDFGKLAAEFSEDPGSAAQGGTLGYVKRGEMVPEFEAEAMRLKPGELSNIIETEYGFHLIQLLDKRGAEYNARHILLKPVPSEEDFKATEKFLDSLANRIRLDSISFEKAAKDFSEDKRTAASGGFLSDGYSGSYNIPLENLDHTVYFTIENMEVGDISEPTRFKDPMGRDAVRIIWFKTKSDPHKANLKDDWQKISNAALQNKQADAVNDWFERTRKEEYISVNREYNSCKVFENDLVR